MLKALLLPIFMLLYTPYVWSNSVFWDWDYHGSGRDTSYSQKIDDYYSLGYVPRTRPVDAVVLGMSSAAPPPPPALQPDPGKPDQYTITFPDGHGGMTAVVLKRSGEGFVGPKGEYYPEFPRPWQLQMKYAGTKG